MRLLLLFIVSLGFALPTSAQNPSCTPGTAEGDLDANNVFARVFNTGSLFYGNTTIAGDGYLVPKDSGNSPLFATGFWIGGTVDGVTRTAGATYTDFEFFPGPLGEDGLPVNDDCSVYDRIYVVSQADIDAYEGGGTATDDLADWPVGLGAPTVDVNGDPVESDDLDDVIDLEAGERPAIKGDQAAWWIMNDAAGPHLSTLTDPLGIEVRVLAYAYATDNAYDDATLYDVGITYKGDATVEDAYLGVFSDPDVGGPEDDYVGSDPERGLGFAYNADASDSNYGTPPAVGFDFLSCAVGTDGEPTRGNVMYFSNALNSPTGDPEGGAEYYNFLQAVWGDGTPLTVGGDGYNPGSTDFTDFAFPAAPPEFWSEFNTDGNGTSNPAGDRRFLVSNGPLTFEPGEEVSLTLGILWALGDDNLDSVDELKAASDFIQQDFEGCALVSNEGAASPSGLTLDAAYPNPFAVQTQFDLSFETAGPATVEVLDVLGRRVALLLDETVAAGPRTLTWTPSAAQPNGLYFVRMIVDATTATRAVVLQR